MKDQNQFRIALRNQAYAIYHMGKAELNEPEVFAKFETTTNQTQAIYLTGRHCMGALYGYYRSGLGSKKGLEFWEEKMRENYTALRKFLH